MSVGAALRQAVVDFYEQSWRLVLLNGVVSAGAITILTVSLYTTAALVLVPLVGPLIAALMHCAVTLAQTGDLRLADAVDGLRLHWRRGLVLGLLFGVFVVASVIAFRFYAEVGAGAWPLSVLVLYLGGIFALYQLALWPLAIFERERPLRGVLADAGIALLRRPAAFTGLGIALLLVNVAGLAAAVLPFLTMTIAYSFVAAARFTLPPSPLQEA